MRVFVTGAGGFVGAHTARALLRAGHEVRLLVRDPQPVRTYFARHGHPLHDLVVGDMRDAETVRRGLAGCDAVVHAAALVSLDSRRSEEIYRNNVDGIQAVLGSACALGIESIVYVSSLSVLFQSGITQIDESTPLGRPREPYARSKRDCDEHVRRMQENGAPIQISYPSGVVGPDDPKLCESNGGIRSFVSMSLPITTSGFQFVDARDLAQAHRYMVENPVGNPQSGRFIVAGNYQSWRDLRALLERVTGRRAPAMHMPGVMLRAIGEAADMLRRLRPFESQISAEAMKYVTQWVPAVSDRILRAAQMRFRSSEETLADTIRWMSAAGHLESRFAGVLANASST